ncbi:pyridoxamine 5'-phosphate oxidase family protein [Candidatus Bathyarchaeota archaeon]|nr:pyridoxamine 5'-phosphate oxidase family protein [Candidatus Bathyarchaeota archaeon]MBS7631128.1 pyridoxamine 5'-phosphate oxidase family protein [Candidatus Bathyarchaeota archaeon]
MIRSEREIKDLKEIEQILKDASVGRLGTSCEGQPYVIPVNFVYHEGKILIHGARKGKKIDNIASNSKVCFEVDGGVLVARDKPCDYTMKYSSVVVLGEAKITTDPDEMFMALKLLMEKYSSKELSEQLTRESVARFKNLAVIEISIRDMTGKRNIPRS